MENLEQAASTALSALPSWRDGDARRAIVDFVRATCGEDGVPVEQRVAVFDNDGTLWCEKPMPIQLDFILRRLVAMAEAEPELRARQPWKAAYERDYGWLSAVIAQHYAGDDTNVRILGAGVLAAFEGISVDDFEAQSEAFLRDAQHPTLGRGYLECAYAPMIELLSYLEANGFSNYIASGGGRDFMRPISHELYGIPRERVIGSSAALAYVHDERGGMVMRKAAADYLDQERLGRGLLTCSRRPTRTTRRRMHAPLIVAAAARRLPDSARQRERSRRE